MKILKLSFIESVRVKNEKGGEGFAVESSGDYLG